MKFKATRSEDRCVKIKDTFGDKLRVVDDDGFLLFQVNDGARVIVEDETALKLARLIKRTVKARR